MIEVTSVALSDVSDDCFDPSESSVSAGCCELPKFRVVSVVDSVGSTVSGRGLYRYQQSRTVSGTSAFQEPYYLRSLVILKLLPKNV